MLLREELFYLTALVSEKATDLARACIRTEASSLPHCLTNHYLLPLSMQGWVFYWCEAYNFSSAPTPRAQLLTNQIQGLLGVFGIKAIDLFLQLENLLSLNSNVCSLALERKAKCQKENSFGHLLRSFTY